MSVAVFAALFALLLGGGPGHAAVLGLAGGIGEQLADWLYRRVRDL